jgi:hypothetical protein
MCTKLDIYFYIIIWKCQRNTILLYYQEITIDNIILYFIYIKTTDI